MRTKTHVWFPARVPRTVHGCGVEMARFGKRVSPTSLAEGMENWKDRKSQGVISRALWASAKGHPVTDRLNRTQSTQSKSGCDRGRGAGSMGHPGGLPRGEGQSCRLL